MMVYWRLFALCFGLHSASMSHAAMNRLQPEYHSRPIDREAVVRRHFPTVSNITPTSFLALGNGQFGFAVDGTGLQTFNETQSSLCLLSDMHWFTSPYLGPGTDPWTDTMANNVFVELNTTTNIGEQRTVNYPVNCDGDPESSCHWLAVNPVRLDLGQLKFTAAGGDALKRTDIGSVNQSLDTWSGTMHSNWQHVPSKLHVEAQTVRPSPNSPSFINSIWLLRLMRCSRGDRKVAVAHTTDPWCCMLYHEPGGRHGLKYYITKRCDYTSCEYQCDHRQLGPSHWCCNCFCNARLWEQRMSRLVPADRSYNDNGRPVPRWFINDTEACHSPRRAPGALPCDWSFLGLRSTAYTSVSTHSEQCDRCMDNELHVF